MVNEVHHIYLSERVLRQLLDKIETYKNDEETFLTVVQRGTARKQFQDSTDIVITAIPDEAYYHGARGDK